MYTLIVGLGNPGKKYENTKHNVGAIMVDYIKNTISPLSSYTTKFQGMMCIVDYLDKKIILFKPQTYMNDSGIAVTSIKNFFKISNDSILVIQDDLDLKNGDIRTKNGGNNGGHNGIKSLDSHIGKNYWRLRIGIGRPIDNSSISNYVLSKIDQQQKNIFDTTMKNIMNIFDTLIFKPEIFKQEYHKIQNN